MKKVALFESTHRREAYQWAEFAAKKLTSLGIEVCASQALINRFDDATKESLVSKEYIDFEKFADVVLSFGGDGTMLSAAREFIATGMPIMGVNVGRLGFLAEFAVKELDRSLDDLIHGNYRIVSRTVFETNLNDERVFSLNDFVIEKKDTSRMITVGAYANDNYIGDYRADGLIMTLPTGSTAYNLSCGGPIISPNAPVICLTPISPHSLTHRPLVIPDTNEIKLKLYAPNGIANLVADGQVTRTLKNNEAVSFRKSQETVKLIKPIGKSFFDLLRDKLLWAKQAVNDLDEDKRQE